MTKLQQFRNKLSCAKWIIPVCFGVSCSFLAAAIAMISFRGFSGMEKGWIFSIGADLFCLAVCVMLCFSCLLGYKQRHEHTLVFMTLLTTNALALLLDESAWVVQGIPELITLNLVINVLYFMTGVILIYEFWQYIRRVLKMENSLMEAADGILNIMLIPTLLLCAVNFFYPLYFSISPDGFYQREDKWYISQVYLFVALLIVVLELIMSTASRKDRLVAFSFGAIPLLNQVLTGFTFGISTQYAAMMVSVVLIYGVLFAEFEKTVSNTEMELNVATRIQSSMLPDTRAFLPGHSEFDIHATMTPAKEVGGDFFDFFMVDDDHLALVIADVSGKGIPASLFMMASKMLIKNNAMTGISPGEVLKKTNDQICENNKEEMFVTVWLGILDLRDGTLVTANAGHEYPALKRPGGGFEIMKTKHGFVVGGMKGIKYRETELVLEPGAKLFVYTDGVPEAENAHKKQYGMERFLETLNQNKDRSPAGLLEAVEADVQAFVQGSVQFDDLTMLCVQYFGKEDKHEGADN